MAFRARLILGRRLLLAVALILMSLQASAADLTGAGATFPYPVYAKWAEAYRNATGIGLNYQSIGSGGGIKQIKSGTVDFGASDMPLKADELQQSGLVQFPTILGGVVPVMNIKGIQPGEVKLTGPILADIFSGKITKWNDQAIAATNPGKSLPNKAIAVVHRSDGSGTTFLFTTYLSQSSSDWGQRVGANTSVQWPVGLGGKGNEGVAAMVGQTDGAIGYVEFAYALQNHMAHAQLQNRNGQFVQPSMASFQAAAADADWKSAPGLGVVLTNQPGSTAWPITGASFILMRQQVADATPTRQALGFFDWAFSHGGQMAQELGYVPLPSEVVALIQQQEWPKIKDSSGNPVWRGSVESQARSP